jgi:energy-converting hydrogenase B subunit D
MIEILGHGFVLAGLIIAAIVIITFRDLLSAAIAFGIFSFLLSLEFYILQAPDVAIAEAGIGAGLTTAIFILAIRGTERMEDGRK